MKCLGIVLFALAAWGGVGAGGASAKVVHDFKSNSSSVIITGEQTAPFTFKFGAGSTLTCLTSKANGTVKTPTSELTVEFTNSNCTLNEMTATFESNRCHYVFTGETKAGFEHADYAIECEPGTKLLVKVSGCTLEIPAQTAEAGAGYKETESGGVKDVDVAMTSTGGIYTKTGILCGLIGGNGSDLSITGTYTMKAYTDNENKEGSQTSFWFESTIT
ncbi:MAG TPA: hypothetical protein VFS26_03810 [Solirubrobacterales bacterium]|nr:hypothetical protein [Solirubrobacterales bacterium]